MIEIFPRTSHLAPYAFPFSDFDELKPFLKELMQTAVVVGN